jgi:protein phosphatase
MSDTPSLLLESVALTDRGQVRDHNEDTVFENAELGLAVLADGMGGYNAGEVASRLAVDTVSQGFQDVIETAGDDFRNGTMNVQNGLMEVTIFLRDQIVNANRVVYESAINEPDCEGMGTTIVCAAVSVSRIAIAHVGDSRAYRLRDHHLLQLTRDHSLLQEQIDHDEWKEEQADEFPRKNLVTRALGAERYVQVDVAEFEIQPQDVYLLCSDGLTDMLAPPDVQKTLDEMHDSPLTDIATTLVEQANQRGGRDNISVILLRISEQSGAVA